ncbi:MAG: hypothetical protein NTV49_10805 [Kiritimatiellaeota bacterium]|nr:hypothetical protein [Kiritimatiellota bacterium]
MGEARKGKIARLQRALRDEVCVRLQDGATGAEICAWLNGLPAVVKLLAKSFRGEPISEQNVSTWRGGGYAEWALDNARAEEIRRQADLAYQLAKAGGGNLSEGACAVAAGKIQDLLESLETENLPDMVKALASLRKMELATLGEKNDRVKLQQNERALALEEVKFQRTTCELFLQWFANEKARRIAESPAAPSVRIEELRELMFGKA